MIAVRASAGRRPSTRFPPDAPVSVCRLSRRPYFRAADLRTATGSARRISPVQILVSQIPRRFALGISPTKMLAC
jgi:hypothetical protein